MNKQVKVKFNWCQKITLPTKNNKDQAFLKICAQEFQSLVDFSVCIILCSHWMQWTSTQTA